MSNAVNAEDIKIYRLDDQISFRKCSLHDGKAASHGDCTNFTEREENWKPWYYCCQDGIHLHCTKHPEIEFDLVREPYSSSLLLHCPKCNKDIEIQSLNDITQKCMRMLNIELFKGARLIRLDDWYIPEVKAKEKTTDYWITTDVKKDRDGDTIIVIYVGHKGSSEKAQFFIKPEKLQLSSDYKDMDPAKVLSKIVVTLKDRTLGQKYE